MSIWPCFASATANCSLGLTLQERLLVKLSNINADDGCSAGYLRPPLEAKNWLIQSTTDAFLALA